VSAHLLKKLIVAPKMFSETGRHLNNTNRACIRRQRMKSKEKQGPGTYKSATRNQNRLLLKTLGLPNGKQWVYRKALSSKT